MADRSGQGKLHARPKHCFLSIFLNKLKPATLGQMKKSIHNNGLLGYEVKCRSRINLGDQSVESVEDVEKS